MKGIALTLLFFLSGCSEKNYVKSTVITPYIKNNSCVENLNIVRLIIENDNIDESVIHLSYIFNNASQQHEILNNSKLSIDLPLLDDSLDNYNIRLVETKADILSFKINFVDDNGNTLICFDIIERNTTKSVTFL